MHALYLLRVYKRDVNEPEVAIVRMHTQSRIYHVRVHDRSTHAQSGEIQS